MNIERVCDYTPVDPDCLNAKGDRVGRGPRATGVTAEKELQVGSSAVCWLVT